VSDLPAHLEVADTDKVGRLYNVLRKELGFLPDETGNGFEEKMGSRTSADSSRAST
jgi:hypothetical protein